MDHSPTAMGLFDEHERVSAGGSVESETRGSAALMVRDLRLVDLRDAWLFAEAQAGVALHAWFSAPRQERQDAYAAYVAALDREEVAASLLAARLAILADSVWESL
jgi:hypothetical protein